MIKYEINLPDAWAESSRGLRPEEFLEFLARAREIQSLLERQTEARQRRILFWFLLGTGAVVLGVSLFLLVVHTFSWGVLPGSTAEILAGSIAGEFVAMLWFVVRYLFPQGGRNG